MATIEDSIRLQLARATAAGRASRISPSDSPCPSVSPCLRSLGSETQILAGNVGDHPRLLQLLVQAYQTPLADDFQSRLDEPLYEASDRLLLQHTDQQLLGHVHVAKLIGWFHGQRCPLARLQDFLTLPEYRSYDFDSPLLETAESVAHNEGAILGFVRTDRPEWFEQHGWSACRGQGHTRANTRAILSHFDAQQSKRPYQNDSLEIRAWRHFELDSIIKVYQQLSTNMWGTLQRSLETWQWLVGRKAHDQILIAVDHTSQASRKRPEAKHSEANPQATNKDDTIDAEPIDLASQPNVVGYAVVRDSCIVEMLTLPGYSAARPLLMARACRDAIDRDHHFVSLHTPAADPMHELLVTAGGSWVADGATSGGQAMLKLLAPERWIERLYPLLHERAREAGIQRPLEIDFALENGYRRLTLTRRSSRLEPITNPRAPIQCTALTLQDLLISNLTFPEAIAQGRLRTPHLSLLRTLAALFPAKLFWQSPFPVLRL